MVLKLGSSEALEGFLKHRLLPFYPRVSDSAGLGRGLVMCMSRKFPLYIDAVGLEPLVYAGVGHWEDETEKTSGFR